MCTQHQCVQAIWNIVPAKLEPGKDKVWVSGVKALITL